MLADYIKEKNKIHSRRIELETYQITANRMIVHGILKDQRYIRVFDATGALKEPGIVHHIDVKLLIRSGPFTIKATEAQMREVPIPECRETLDNLPQIHGLQVKSGFSKKVRSLVGGQNGCHHLAQLIAAMGQEIVSGGLTQTRTQKRKLPDQPEQLQEKQFIFDSCRMWKRDGPRYKNLVRAIQAEHE